MIGPGHGRALRQELEQASDPHRTLLRLIAYLRPFRGHLLLVGLFVLVNTLLTVAAPRLIGEAVDLLWRFFNGEIQADSAWGGLNHTMLLLLGTYAGVWATNLGSFYLMTVVSQNVLCELRAHIFAKIQELSLSFFDRHEAGDLMSRLTNDTDVINRVLGMGLIRLTGSALTLVGILVAMLGLNWRLALASFTVLPAMVFTTIFFSNRARRAFRRTRQTIGGVSAELEENIAGVKVVQAFSREDENLEAFRQVNAANRDAGINAETITAAFSPSLDVLGIIGTAIVVGYGGYLALNDLVTIGVIVAFVQYVRRFFQPVRAVALIWGNLQSAIAGAERIFELLDTPAAVVDVPDAGELPTIAGRVAFEEICFEYKPGEPVLREVNLLAEPGQTVALVGPTGAGKTTIINLIGRFYDTCAGRVTVDGHDVRQISRASLRRQMGIVLQDTFLFSGTVMENIRYGRLDASDAEVVEAAKLANAHRFITRLPDGYQTELTEQASNLSQGQRQLISIARAVLANPRILILDEATSSVDTRTELLIQNALRNLLRGRTSFVIAHRLSTIRNADQVLFIRDGRIVERGTPQELLARQGAYYELYMSQFRREAEREMEMEGAAG
jgi:ATP-binding cassette subfamily B multidrug efflux pump